MVLLRRSHRLWPAPLPSSALHPRPCYVRYSQHDATPKKDRPEQQDSDDTVVLPLGPPTPPEHAAAPPPADKAEDVLAAATQAAPSQSEASLRAERSSPDPQPTDPPKDKSDASVMQELLKLQQEQLQKEKDLQKEEQQLQEKAGRKLKAFELLERKKTEPEQSDRPVTWADPASVAEATAAATAAATTSSSSATLSIPSISTEEFKKRLAEWKSALDKKSRELAQQADKNFSLLGLRVNEVTGYREVELLKEAVKNREREIEEKRKEVRDAKAAYEAAVTTLSKTQQDVQALLERKHTWTDHDVAHFTQLVRSDHASKNAVETTSQQLKAAELSVDKAFTALMQSILERYHEEQVWSDKIRSVSTWASLAVLGANLIVFVGAIAFVEPWKRKRLVEGLEERMTGMMAKVDSQLQSLSDRVGNLEPQSLAAVDAVPLMAVSNDDPSPTETPAPEPVTTTSTSTNMNDMPSPIHTLEPHLSAIPYGPQVFAWSTDSLDKLAAPSAERDLAAAAAFGAVAGALTIGAFSLIASLIRH